MTLDECIAVITRPLPRREPTPVALLVWIDTDRQVWVAPYGTPLPLPGQPMGVAWKRVTTGAAGPPPATAPGVGVHVEGCGCLTYDGRWVSRDNRCPTTREGRDQT